MDSPANPDLLADLVGEAEFSPRPQRGVGASALPVPGGTNLLTGEPVVTVLPPDPTAMGEKYLKLHTQNRLRQHMLALTNGNIDFVQRCLHEVGKDSPAKAVELFIELMKFSMPQLREATLNVTKGGEQRTYRSSEEILQELNQGTPQ